MKCNHWARVWGHSTHKGRFDRWLAAEPQRHGAGPCKCGADDAWTCYWRFQRAHLFGPVAHYPGMGAVKRSEDRLRAQTARLGGNTCIS